MSISFSHLRSGLYEPGRSFSNLASYPKPGAVKLVWSWEHPGFTDEKRQSKSYVFGTRISARLSDVRDGAVATAST